MTIENLYPKRPSVKLHTAFAIERIKENTEDWNLSLKCNFPRVYSLRRDILNWRKQNFNQNLRTCYFVKLKNNKKTLTKHCSREKAVRDPRINTVLIKLVWSSNPGRSFSIVITWDPQQYFSSRCFVIVRRESWHNAAALHPLPLPFFQRAEYLLNRQIKTQQGPSQALSQIVKEPAFANITSGECFHNF